MHYVHGNTFSFHLSVLTLDTKNVLYLPLWPWKPLSPLCPALYQQFSLTKSDKLYTVNPNIHTMSEYCTVDPTYGFWILSGVSHVQVMWHIYVSTIWKIIGYWTDYLYQQFFGNLHCQFFLWFFNTSTGFCKLNLKVIFVFQFLLFSQKKERNKTGQKSERRGEQGKWKVTFETADTFTSRNYH